MKDQFVQEWQNSVFNSSKCSNYRIFKTEFKFENYLVDFPTKLRINYSKFRCRSHRLPIEEGIFSEINKESRLCTKCDLLDIGNEFHYIFKCPSLQSERKSFQPSILAHNVLSFKKLFNSSGETLINLCKLISCILEKFSS